ncbi:3'-5' exoribonuclease domain-containing protein [Streptomyces sp. NPDC002755]|uniref:3'-5' exoribonuclease domain-containing protein n=1 Tax=Streptomyces sp. NPDC002884 TaxID=3154544 RepID=UPI00332A22DB
MSVRRVKPSLYISVDVEADGPIPGPYSLLSLGAAVAGRQDADGFTAADPTRQTFYRELRPISDEFVPEALAVSGLDRGRLAKEGLEPALALAQFTRWVREVSADAQPVMCGYPASYDWTFLYWYLIRFTGESPFGHSGCLDMKTLYATKAGLPLRAVAKRTMPAHLLSRRPHTHHALDDAVEQAELLANLMAWPGPGSPGRVPPPPPSGGSRPPRSAPGPGDGRPG